ncbi:hypothetical protein [Actinocorallia longicatena]|uniref:Copper(I)-binding protein n=1 Tax=Actinocorallia longicatena TaxID=111803 RepID=A0ABP6QDU4_9ACTN
MIRKVALLAAAGSLVLAGCGTGVDAGSAEPTQLTEGVNFSQGGIDARNVFVLGPKPGSTVAVGSDVPVYGSLINNASDSADALTSISVAAGADGRPLATAGLIQGAPLTLPAHQLVQLAGPTGPLVTLKGVTTALRGGEHIRLTLAFKNAKTISISVPVVPAQGSYATLSPAPSTGPVLPTATPGATATPGTTATAKPTTTATPAKATPTATKKAKKA